MRAAVFGRSPARKRSLPRRSRWSASSSRVGADLARLGGLDERLERRRLQLDVAAADEQSVAPGANGLRRPPCGTAGAR